MLSRTLLVKPVAGDVPPQRGHCSPNYTQCVDGSPAYPLGSAPSTSVVPLALQRHLIHSLGTPVLEVVVTYPSWLTSDALRASRALRPPPPRRMAAPFGASSEGP